jgi:signal peptidase I
MNDDKMKDRFSVARELQDDLFNRNGLGWFKVVSMSMYPVIEINDRVLVKKTAIDKVISGDIVLFKVDRIFIVHRIIKIMKKDGSTILLQKGDANNYAGIIFPESIVGKIVSIEKNGKIIELESLRWKCINALPVMKNCLFHKRIEYCEQYKGKTKKSRFFLYPKCLSWVISRSFAYCNRIILRILLHSFQ